MVFKDDPDHKRLRTLVHKAFTPKLVSTMESDIVKIAEQLADEVAAKRDIDMAHDYAVRLPLAVIATMLGVADKDRDEFQVLVEKLGDGGRRLNMITSARRLVKLFEELIEERRIRPDEGLITDLIHARRTVTSSLTRDRRHGLPVVVGRPRHHRQPDRQQRARAHRASRAAGAAARAAGTVGRHRHRGIVAIHLTVASGAARLAKEDVEIHGVKIARGAQLLGMIASANRDETVFDNPESLDLTRKPNRHLAFNYGLHYCLGHQLARLEGRIALTTLLQPLPALELTAPRESLHYKPTVSLRGLTKLPIRMY
jgi:cytochrome P450 PksS